MHAELNSAIAPRKARLDAIRTALEEFDHTDTALHDEELDVQADRILYQKLALAYAVSRSSDGVVAGYSTGQEGPRQHNGDADEELELIATALEMVYRASRSMVALSFTEVGRSMLPLCIDMIGNPNPPETQRRIGSKSTSQAEEEAVVGRRDPHQEGMTKALHNSSSSNGSESDASSPSSSLDHTKGGLKEGKKRPSSADMTLHTSATSTTMDSTEAEESNVKHSGSEVDPPSETAKEAMEPEGDKDPFNQSTEIFTRVDGDGNDDDDDGDDDEEEEEEGLNKKSDDGVNDNEDGQDQDSDADSYDLGNDDVKMGPLARKLEAATIADVSEGEQDNVSEISDAVGVGLPHADSAALSRQIAGGNVLAPQDSASTSAGETRGDIDAQGKSSDMNSSSKHGPSAFGTTASRRNRKSTYADDVEGDDEDLYVAWKHQLGSDDEKEEEAPKANEEEDQDNQDDSLGKQRKIRFWDERSASGMMDAPEEGADGQGQSSSLTKDYAEDEGKINAVATSKIVKILRYYSRVLSAMSPMARQVGLLDALIYQMGRRLGTYKRRSDVDLDGNVERDDDDSDIVIAPDGTEQYFDPTATAGWIEHQKKMLDAEVAPIRVDAVATLVNLACAEENKTLMLNHPGLLDAVIDVANSDPSEEAREHGAIVLMNLAYADDNKIAMGHNEDVLSTLGDLAGDKSPFTRKYSTAALFTLACIPQNASHLACHREGYVLSALSRLLLEDPIEEARINAAEAAFNLAKNAANAASDESVVLALGNHVGLLPSLAHAVMADSNADVRTYAARTLEWLASDIHNGMPCHDNLLRALTKATLWTKTCCIVEALAAQAMVAENRLAMVLHDGLLDALASLALLEDIGDEEVRNCAISTLVELTKEESLRETMARNEGVMTALTHATFARPMNSNTTYRGKQSPLITKTKIALKNLAAVLEEG